MAVVNTRCSKGHALAGKSLKAVVPCKGCGELVSTVYDCVHGDYGKCAACWVREHRDDVPPVAATPGEVQ